MGTTRRVVIMDDEPGFAETLQKMLNGFGFEVAIVTDAAARETLNLENSDIVFVDITTPPLSWRQLLRQLARQDAKAAIVMMGRQFEPLEEAEKFAKKLKINLLGAIEKPFRLDDLMDILPGAN